MQSADGDVLGLHIHVCFEVEAALINIFTLATEQMFMCNVKGSLVVMNPRSSSPDSQLYGSVFLGSLSSAYMKKKLISSQYILCSTSWETSTHEWEYCCEFAGIENRQILIITTLSPLLTVKCLNVILELLLLSAFLFSPTLS